jgi:hypothetical protein
MTSRSTSLYDGDVAILFEPVPVPANGIPTLATKHGNVPTQPTITGWKAAAIMEDNPGLWEGHILLELTKTIIET